MSDMSKKLMFGLFIFISSQFIIDRSNKKQFKEYHKWEKQIDDEYVEYINQQIIEELKRDQRVIGN